MTSFSIRPIKKTRGFSLLELGIVLIIVSLLAGGMLSALSGQRASDAWRSARMQLEAARESLLAFAVVHGRLPCPAKATLSRDDTGNGSEDCALEHGVLPWVTLGLPETDPWNQRLSYFASSKFTRTPETGSAAGFTLETGTLTDTSGLADIRNLIQNGNAKIAIDVAAVVVCHGQQGPGAYLADGRKLSGATAEESENSDADLEFVSDAPSTHFDDQLTWISPNLLKARLVAVGKLP